MDARILRLRRAAVADIFDQLGLDIIPGQVWAFVDGSDDVATGLDRFFAAMGVQSGGLRDRDAAELARANEVLELLVDVGDAFERLPATVRSEVARRLAGGHFETVRETAKAVAALERIQRLAGAWPEDRRLGLFNAFLDQLRFALDDPLDLSAEDVSRAEAGAAALSALLIRFEELRISYARICAELRSDWPADWSAGAQTDRFDRDAALFESLAEMLHTERDTDFASVEGALDELAATLARLGELHAEALAWIHRGAGGASGDPGGSRKRSDGARGGSAGPGGAKGSKGADPGAPLSLREQALEFFGFSRSARPKIDEIKARWKAFMKAHHPDLGPPSEYHHRNRLSQEASMWKDILCGV